MSKTLRDKREKGLNKMKYEVSITIPHHKYFKLLRTNVEATSVDDAKQLAQERHPDCIITAAKQK